MIYLYTNEIQQMMFTSGDVKNPLKTAAEYVEIIIKNQIKDLLSKADRIRKLRKGKNISCEDVLFVIRKNKPKLNRLINYLNIKNLNKSMTNENYCIQEEIKYDWVISGTENTIDSEYKMKLQKIDELTKSMSKESYIEFSEARQASFTYKKSKKFRNFISPFKVMDESIDLLGCICSDMVYLLVIHVLNGNNLERPITIDDLKVVSWELSIKKSVLY